MNLLPIFSFTLYNGYFSIKNNINLFAHEDIGSRWLFILYVVYIKTLLSITTCYSPFGQLGRFGNADWRSRKYIGKQWLQQSSTSCAYKHPVKLRLITKMPSSIFWTNIYDCGILLNEEKCWIS